MTVMDTGTLAEVAPTDIVNNPNNPRRYFNDERLDLLRTSIQEVGILVPLIVYRGTPAGSQYVLMDGERRWRCSLDLGLSVVPVNVIQTPTPLDNLLRMFNIHNVREEWPLISVALSLRDVMDMSGVSGEKRLSELTGLTRSTVRRARRLLSLPDQELELIRGEAHLDRSQQVHREDLYLEIEAAESVLATRLPELAQKYGRDKIIRKFAEKRETGHLIGVTEFRYVGRLVKAADDEIAPRAVVLNAADRLISDVTLSPERVYAAVAAEGYRQQAVMRKAEVLADELDELLPGLAVSDALRSHLHRLRDVIDRVLRLES